MISGVFSSELLFLYASSIEVPKILADKIDDFLTKKMYKMLNEIIVMYEDEFYTNF